LKKAWLAHNSAYSQQDRGVKTNAVVFFPRLVTERFQTPDKSIKVFEYSNEMDIIFS
jgi:hypothetical protein